MTNERGECGGVLLTTLVLGVLLSVLGGVAMNLVLTDREMAHHQRKEAVTRMLAESGIEQVTAWLNHGMLPGRALPTPSGCRGGDTAPDVTYDASRTQDALLLNDSNTGVFRAFGDLGQIEKIHLYASVRPDGFCTVMVTAQGRNRLRRSVAVELGATQIPSLHAAIQSGPLMHPDRSLLARMWAHWGSVRIAGDVHLRHQEQFPRKWTAASITGVSYVETGASFEDPWTEIWVGGRVQSDDQEYVLSANVHPNQDPVPGIPSDPWQYEKFKRLAMRFGHYYVPDITGRLYRNGIMDPARGQTLADVVAENSVANGLIFVDTLDQKPPAPHNVTTLIVNSSSLDGVFFINANVVLSPEGKGKTISVSSPPTDSQALATRVAATLSDVNVNGVFHTTGRLQVDHQVRVFGSVVAEQGITGDGLLEVWYDYDASRGLFRGLPVVYPLSGSWREWGN
jgi:hypothetical protein